MDDSKKTPLERYLEKQKKNREPKPPSSIEARRAQTPQPTSARAQFRAPPEQALNEKWEKKAIDQGVPVVPASPPSQPSAALGAEFLRTRGVQAATPQAQSPSLEDQPTEIVGADVGPRFVAWMADLAILFCIQWPISKIVFGALAIVSTSLTGEVRQALEFFFSYALLFGYYGYFYSKKAASPGKMLLGLSIYDESTGKPLSAGKAFFREALGKFISAVPFFIGFMVALFRYDRRALHDLLFDTRVVRNITPTQSGIRR